MKKLLKKLDIEVLQDKSSLVLKCAGLERRIDLSSNVPKTVSLTYKGKYQLAQDKPETASQDFTFIGLNKASDETPCKLLSVKAEWKDTTILEAAHAEVQLEMMELCGETRYLRTYILYPGVPAIGVHTAIKSPVMPNTYWSYRDIPHSGYDPDKREGCVDKLRLPFVATVKSIEYFGRTDYTDKLYEEHVGLGQLKGNLLIAEAQQGFGLVMLQEAPPSTERRDLEKHDFRVEATETDTQLFSCCWGIPPNEVSADRYICSYRHVLIAFEDKAKAQHAVKAYLKARFPMDERCGKVVVNPWGCGLFPELVCEEFLKKEITASAKLDADYYQVDDSWQAGKALQMLTRANQHITPAFWEVSENLHGTFKPLCDAAAKAGMKLGLWIAPSCNCEYRDWRETADIICNMHKKYGFDLIKIDAVRCPTHLAEENLEALLKTVRERTKGKIYFNLDTTNGQRPGYFLFLEYGNIFLENRYVCRLWGLGYHPEKTLRSLWQLSRYMRPQFLQIEVPYTGDINNEFYKNKPRPDIYPTDYWAAISLFASPLLWLAPSRCDKAYVDVVSKVMKLHHRIWPDLAQSEIYPIGNCPDGRSISGFQAHNDATGHGYLLLFREVACPYSAVQIKLASPVGGQFSEITRTGLRQNAPLPELLNEELAEIRMPSSASFAIWKY
ncbi:MAG: hypothetical protein IKP00_15835 [Victivallales bacterium]|nr:hypothetical protein [Victivallales bacterium]